MKLQVSPLIALCDKKINISISQLPPLTKVKISASMSLPWAKTVKFQSFAYFTADSNGNLDLSTQKPDSGSYDFIDSMGLIVSMKMVNGKLKDITQGISVDNTLFIDIVAECETQKDSVRLERLFKNPELKSLKISDEFVGELFYTEKTSNITIVTLGGSDGNSNALSLISALLASHGFNVLSVAYFSNKGLPKHLSEIPLEYFEKIFQWLKKNPITNNSDIYLHGTSKGGELALLLASRYSFIKKVAAVSPHAYCFQGLNYKNVSSWSFKGKSLPFIPLKNGTLFKNMLSCFIRNEPFGYTYTYKTCVDNATNKEEARIKVENSNADILLISGKNDNIWNSYDGCVEIINTLTKCAHKKIYSHLAYEGAGHPFHLPYILPVSLTTSMKLAPRFVFSSGGELVGNLNFQKDSWDKTIKFFKNTH
ncbi:MAG: acyl-CoA thioesterase/bile acid-CoA:amino acid N-acyltransferase family protein [Clostridiaceae bacterium]